MYNNLLKPVILGAVILVLCEFAKYAFGNIINYLILAVILGVFGLMFYGFLVYFGRVFTPKELEQFRLKRTKISK